MLSDEQLKAVRAQQTLWVDDPATPPQVRYITGLIESRQVPERWLLRIKELTEAGLTKGKAGEIIAALKPLPLKPGQDDRSKNNPSIQDMQPGRFAVPHDWPQQAYNENDIDFYRVKEVKRQDGSTYKIMLRIAGPNEHLLRGAEAKDAAKRIVRYGIGNAASLYGHKIGRCSICHTRITNRISRELGIGPICGGRVFDDWEARVNRARTALQARGLDPDENV